MNVLQNLPQSLKKLRKSRGMTQQELAARLDRETQAVSKWERGQTEISAGLLGSLLAILGYDLEHLDRVLRGLDPEDGLLPLPRKSPSGNSTPDLESPARALSTDDRERLRAEVRDLARRGVATLLHVRGWSVGETARICGWEEEALSEKLRRRDEWTLEELAVLCTAAGIDLSDFFRLAEAAQNVSRPADRSDL